MIDFLKSIDVESADETTVKMLKAMGKTVDDAISGYLKDLIGKEDLKAKLDEAIKGIDKTEELKSVKEQLSELSETLIRIKGAMEKNEKGEMTLKSVSAQIEDQCKDFVRNVDGVKRLDVEAMRKKGFGGIDIVLKETPVSMTTGGSTVAGGITVDNEISVQPRKKYTLRSVSNVAPISTTSVVYAEMKNVTGDAEWVPEGGLKPSMKAELDTKTVNVGKVALLATITEEIMSDIPQFEAEIRNEIINKIDAVEEDGILNGDGTSGKIKGVAADFPAFSLTGLEVESPNMYDAIVACYTQITSTSNMSYSPNGILMNPVDYANMQLTKNANGDYIRPFRVGDELITGLRVIPDGNRPVGNFIMGDFGYLYIRDYSVLRIDFGWNNDDFSHDRITMRGEKRLLAYVKSQYKTAFVADTFDNVITAITKTQTPAA